MTGKTISGTITKTVTLGSANYPIPLTVTSTGTIDPSATSAAGIYLPALAALATIVNHGKVFGGPGGYNADFAGGAGGTGVQLDSGALLTNTALIQGGAGGSSDTGGGGGIGVYVDATATIVNAGTILGGASGYGRYGTGAGGAGVDMAAPATLTNNGIIFGGGGGGDYAATGSNYGGRGVLGTDQDVVINNDIIAGGAGGISGSATITGADGKTGVKLLDGSTLSNAAGRITGGAGGGSSSAHAGGGGGLGVYLNASTATNTGYIIGGASGYGSYGGIGGVGLEALNYSVITNKDLIQGGAGNGGNIVGGRGGTGASVATYSTLVNSFHIIGGAGGAGTAFGALGSDGGAGVYMNSGSLANSGVITGGTGGNSDGAPSTNRTEAVNAGAGGVGVNGFIYLGQIANTGTIMGGAGGYISGYGGSAGAGGAGVDLLGQQSFTNAGTIIGGTGGYAGQGPGDYGVGGTGGVGLIVGYYVRASSSGRIIGGTGGGNVSAGTTGGTGVAIKGGTFITSGTVQGGAGGYTQHGGTAGLAVYLYGTIAGTLVVDPGAVFSGTVESAGYASNVLELAGSSGTVLQSFGSEFVGFGDVSFATGATRAIEGTFTPFTAIEGFATHDTIILDGSTVLPDATSFTASEIILDQAGTLSGMILPHTLAKDILVEQVGAKTTLIGATGTLGHTIATGTGQFVLNGGTGTSTLIKIGGYEEIYRGGTAVKTTIGGGTLKLDIGATIAGGIGFSTVTGGTLVIESATMPTSTISGFIAGDTIDLAGVVYNKNDTVTVATAGTVTINAPGVTYKLDIAGATVGETDLHFGAGSRLTRTAAAKAMPFLDAVATPHHAVPGLTHAGLTMADFGTLALGFGHQLHVAATLPHNTIAHSAGAVDLAAPFKPDHAVIPHQS